MATSDFECDACQEDTNSKKYTIGLEKYCRECAHAGVVSSFDAALKNENDFPPKIGQIVLQVQEFEDLLPVGFRIEWRRRLLEYSVSVPERLYCPNWVDKTTRRIGTDGKLDICGAFISPNEQIIPQCSDCHGYACRGCGGIVSLDQHHECRPAQDDNAFVGLQLGKDYQICPSARCRVKLELKDGCNHLVCRCGANFCFLCGQEVDGPDCGHWYLGNPCPRYGRPDVQPVYDEDPEVDSDEYNFEDENDSDVEGDDDKFAHIPRSLRIVTQVRLSLQNTITIRFAGRDVPGDVIEGRDLLSTLENNLWFAEIATGGRLNPNDDNDVELLTSFRKRHATLEAAKDEWRGLFGEIGLTTNLDFTGLGLHRTKEHYDEMYGLLLEMLDREGMSGAADVMEATAAAQEDQEEDQENVDDDE